jgi:hypothetical protein
MNLGTHPARVVAAVVAVVAAGTTTVLALAAGTAAADEPGRCTQNVNVREDADATSRIVALCEEGTKVVLGAERDHFVWLDKLHGWASTDYVKADKAAGAAGADSASDAAAGDAASEDAAGDDAAADADSADANAATDADKDGKTEKTEAGTAGTSHPEGKDGKDDEKTEKAEKTDAGGEAQATPAATTAPRRVGGIAGLFH